MLLPVTSLVLVLAVGELVIAVSNSSLLPVANELVIAPFSPKGSAARRTADDSDENKKKKRRKEERSTSSDSKDKKEEDEDDDKNDDSLMLSDEEDDVDEDKNGKKKDNKLVPKSTEERHGWRKWHRKCKQCEEDQNIKWRHPSINWLCAGYQTARRSFKSLCNMHLRNCQDGTMFVKIHDHKCKDDPERGKHFFYDYRVRLSDESAKTSDSDSGSQEEEEVSTEYSDDTRRMFRRRQSSFVKRLPHNGTDLNVTATKIAASNDTLVAETAATVRQSNNTAAPSNIDQLKS